MKYLRELKYLLKTGFKSLYTLGFRRTIELTKMYLKAQERKTFFPLQFAYLDYFFETDVDAIRKKDKQIMRETSLLFDYSQVEKTYPNIFQKENIKIRYSFQEAKNNSLGLVVLFHGHNAYLHAGPMEKFDNFDVLAPWDNFGFNRQGSWFWGEKGNNFVEKIIWDLISKFIDDHNYKFWFCFGGSMGGFASLYYGIKYNANGMYVMCPQVDLKIKIEDYGLDNKNNPFLFLMGESGLNSVPDLIDLARNKESLPPLFLMQHQYDSVNSFKKHAIKLINIYSEKDAWLGLRIQPGIGHMADGLQREANLFFKLIVEKNPPHKTNFNF